MRNAIDDRFSVVEMPGLLVAVHDGDELRADAYMGGSPTTARARYYEGSPIFHASEQKARGTRWLIAWETHDEISPPAEHSMVLADELSLAGALVRQVPLVGAPHFWDMEAAVDEAGSFNAQMGAQLLRFLRTWSGW
jgi:hypothetical protein